MPPSTLSAALVFLFIVMPGIQFELLRRRSRPILQASTFIEISRVVFFGVIFAGVSSLLLFLLFQQKDHGVDFVSQLLASGTASQGADWRQAAWPAVMQVVLSLALAHAVERTVSRAQPSRTVRNENVWSVLFTASASSNVRCYLSVETDEAVTYSGYLAGYSSDVDPGSREVAIAAPIVRTKDGNRVALDDSWQRMWFPSEAVKSVAVSYVGVEDRSLTRRATLARWLRLSVRSTSVAWLVFASFVVVLTIFL